MINDDFVPQILYNFFLKSQPDWKIHPHNLKNNELNYIVKGKANYTINGKDYELGQGDLLCLKEGVEAEATANTNSLMQCYTTGFNSLNKENKITPYPFPLVNHIGIRRELVDLFAEMTLSWTNQQAGYVMRTRALLMLIMNYLSEIIIFNADKMTGDYRVNKVISFISAHYSDKITVKELAQRVHLDEAYMGHLFKKETGETVHQHIKRVRVRNAEIMLQSGNYKVYEVAERCGFCDIFNFSKSFKEIKGFPPSKSMLINTRI